MKSRFWPLITCLAVFSVAVAGCGEENSPSAPAAFSTLAATATTNECLNTYLGDLSGTLSQWETALEENRGSDFLTTPPTFSGESTDFLMALSPVVAGWEDSLEAWRGSDFLASPPSFSEDVNDYLTQLGPTLVAWEDSLETWLGSDLLSTPALFAADTTAPAITCLADTTITCSGPEGVAYSFEVSATDSCDSAPVVECTPESGSVFPVGTTTVTCTATDSEGNASECTFDVTVEVDVTPPEITCPEDMTVECTGDLQSTVEFTVTATDDCTAEPAIVSDPPSGSSFPLGTTTVTSTATDDAGNSSSCTFDVTVVDTQPPVITELSAHPTELWPPNHRMADIAVSVTAEDVCDPDVTTWIDSVMSNEPGNDIGDGNTEPDYEITGPLEVRLRMERQGGGAGRTYTLVIMAADSSGNTTMETVDVRVPHDNRSN